MTVNICCRCGNRVLSEAFKKKGAMTTSQAAEQCLPLSSCFISEVAILRLCRLKEAKTFCCEGTAINHACIITHTGLVIKLSD